MVGHGNIALMTFNYVICVEFKAWFWFCLGFFFCLYQDFQETQSDLEVILEFLEECYKQNTLNTMSPVTVDKGHWTLEEDSCRQVWTCGEPPVSMKARPLNPHKTLTSDTHWNVHLLPLSAPRQTCASVFTGTRQLSGWQPKQISSAVRAWITVKHYNEASNQTPLHSRREWWVLLFMVTRYCYCHLCS